MNAIQISYEEARTQMRPGDVIAFGGKGNPSDLIKFVTRSSVSHVGVILQTKAVNDTSDRFFNLLIESTTQKGTDGVRTIWMSDCLAEYDGEIWWLPLREEIRAFHFDEKEFFNFLLKQRGKPYDTPQAVTSALDLLDNLPFNLRGPTWNREDFSKFFCSELVAASFERAGTVGPLNASEITPIDLCRWRIYQDSYYQLKGDASRGISRFNTASPSDWDSTPCEEYVEEEAGEVTA